MTLYKEILLERELNKQLNENNNKLLEIKDLLNSVKSNKTIENNKILKEIKEIISKSK